MKLRATVTIDTEAKDFHQAAKIQQELEELCEELATRHTSVDFDMRERRAQKGSTRRTNVRSKDTTRKYSGPSTSGHKQESASAN